MQSIRSFIVVVPLVFLFSSHHLSAMIATQDKHGSSDHPLVSRYPGSFIYGYSVSEYDEYHFVTGVSKSKKLPTQTVEGKYTTVVYTLPDALSSFQVFKNYEQAFRKAGVKQVLSCTQATCGEYMPKQFLNAQGSGSTKESRYIGVDVYNTGLNSDYRFWTGVLERNGVKTYITFMVHKNSAAISCFLDVIEPKALEAGLVKLNLNHMEAALKSQGKVVLSGLFFDHNKAVLKPASKDSMGVIARYLKNNPNTYAFVVGHTDSSGDYKHNLELSQKRANAVVQALERDYNVSVKRLTAVGIGPVSPAASNNRDGKAENRRVELVLR